MSVHSASPSPRLVAANSPTDETNMPKGHCRYILLHPEIRGQRCACVNFSLNKGIPGATCDCGHLACFHNKEPDAATDQKQELEIMKKRLQHLEEQLSKGHEDVLESVVSRLNEVEDHLEKSREEVGEQIKGAYRNVSMSWRSIEQAERKTHQHDEQLRQIYEKLKDHDEQLDRLHAGQLELRDADLSLEERIENLTETLEEEEELRMSAILASRPRRRSTSDTSRPNVPLGPLGPGAAHLPPTQGGPVINTTHTTLLSGHGAGTGHAGTRPITITTNQQRHHSPRRRPQPASSSSSSIVPSTGAWTVHISLLPHAYVPMPFERNTTAYQRCLSRGLHRTVAVQGRDAASFRVAVERAFGQFLRGREWMPLQAKLCDAETLQGLPMLRQLEEEVLFPTRKGTSGMGQEGWDHEFLRENCAVVDANGVIDSLYIAMRRHTLSWHTLRHSSPVFMEGLEACWAYDALLDKDPFDGDMAVDDEDRPAAGDITSVLPAPATRVLQAVGGGGVTGAVVTVAGLKRPLGEISRSGSFSAGSAGVVAGVTPAAASASTAAAVVTAEVGEDQARVKRACPAPPQGAIVEIRRRDIKTA